MKLLDIYNTCYKKAVELIKDIEDPYERATIYTNIMNSIAKILANNSDIDEDTASETTTAEKTKKKTTKKEQVEETPAPSVNINESVTETVEAPAETVTETEAVNETEEEVPVETESIIDKTSEDDPDEWTDEIVTKYQDEINYITDLTNSLGEDIINDFVEKNTNHVYHSFAEMSPSAFIAVYQLVKQASEQA